MNKTRKSVIKVADARGFTLIELLVVIAIIGVLAAIAMPSLRNMSVHSNLNSDARLTLSVLQKARMEAVKRNKFVTVRFSQAVSGVTHDMVAFVDENFDRVFDAATEEVVFTEDYEIASAVASISGLPAAIFNSRGLPSDSAISTSFFIGNVTLTNSIDSYSKKIVLSRSGRVRIE